MHGHMQLLTVPAAVPAVLPAPLPSPPLLAPVPGSELHAGIRAVHVSRLPAVMRVLAPPPRAPPGQRGQQLTGLQGREDYQFLVAKCIVYWTCALGFMPDAQVRREVQ